MATIIKRLQLTLAERAAAERVLTSMADAFEGSDYRCAFRMLRAEALEVWEVTQLGSIYALAGRKLILRHADADRIRRVREQAQFFKAEARRMGLD